MITPESQRIKLFLMKLINLEKFPVPLKSSANYTVEELFFCESYKELHVHIALLYQSLAISHAYLILPSKFFLTRGLPLSRFSCC